MTFSFSLVGYIGTSISDGPGCLMLRCPDPSCDAAIGQDMITLLATHDDAEKYSKYLIRSYIENNRKVYMTSFYWCLHCSVFFIIIYLSIPFLS